jgi:hypothetical protein
VRSEWLELLRCPACRGRLDVDATREAEGELVEGFLVCRACLEVRVVAAGSAVLPRDVTAHLREQGGVYRRTPLADPRIVRFVLGQAGSGVDVVPFAEVLARYGDLALGADGRALREPAPEDAGLAAHVGALEGRPRRALDLGTGVGRGAFVLAAVCEAVLGVDRSAGRVRRARNVAVTEEPFRVPTPDGTEVDVDLVRLARGGADFAVADPESLPLADASFDLVVDRGADGRGPWPDAGAVAREVARVLAPGGRVLRREPGDAGWRAEGPA